ncbi:MAG: acyl-CoA dehydratase activase-related protein [Chloroflexota bacterium]|nr:acyl-CoA dehydratase activase-related protein [Chloroflexota bacterium]
MPGNSFFKDLGAETVVSQPNNRAIFVLGNTRAVAETYLPAKIFFGHVISLADECDFMFVPAIHRIGGEGYIYSKFLVPKLA